MKTIQGKKLFRKNEDGVVAIEFAFIAPMLFLVFFGLVDLTGFISTSRKVTNASAVVADLVAQNTAPFPQSQLADYFSAVKMILPDRTAAEVRMEVMAYRKVGTAAPTRIWNNTQGGGPACTGTVPVDRMPDLMTAGNDIIVARVCVTYEPFFGTWKGSPVLGALTYNVHELTITRPRARDTITCTDCAAG
jgi:Flp pilus assembly protein TadG